MKVASVVVAMVVVLFAAPTVAQVGVSAPNSFSVEMTAHIEPGNEQVPSGVVAKDWGRVHRFVLDRGQRRYFAYDLVLTPSGAGDRLRVRVEPFSLTAAAMAEGQVIDPSWTAVPVLAFPVVPEVKAGDTLSIDLLQNSATGQRVVDRLVFTRPGDTATRARSPRDFSLSDVHLQLEDPRISINDTLVEASRRLGGGISGGTLWIYLRNHGRFVISLQPSPQRGLRRAGEVDDRSATFTVGGDRIAIRSARRIVPGEGPFHLYVRHDPKWQPTGNEVGESILLGARSGTDWLSQP
jgi:hypothetical protein